MVTTNPREHIELLEVFSRGLVLGIIDNQEIIDWADAILANEPEPDYFMIELSLSGQQSGKDIISVINQFVNQHADANCISGRVILGLVYQRYLSRKISLEKAVSGIASIVWHSNITGTEASLIYRIDEDHYCASEGIYGTMEGVERVMLRFLEIYAQFRIENDSEWKAIDAGIEQRIKALTDEIDSELAAGLAQESEQKNRDRWKPWGKDLT